MSAVREMTWAASTEGRDVNWKSIYGTVRTEKTKMMVRFLCLGRVPYDVKRFRALLFKCDSLSVCILCIVKLS